MSTKTVNGHTKDEVLKLLTANIPEGCLDHTFDGYAYYPMQVYQDRLDEVVGVGNYDYIEDSLSETVVHGVTAINIRGTITIRYDDGDVFIQKSVYGSENVGVRNSSSTKAEEGQREGDPNNLSNSVKAAATDAFVQCCRKLGIADRQLREIRKKEKEEGRTKKKAKDASEFRVMISGQYRSIGEKGFKLPAILDGKEVSIKLWVNSEAYTQIVSGLGTVQNFVSKYKGTEVRVIGKKGEYKGETELEAISLVNKKSA
jgi:hypothetical protein